MVRILTAYEQNAGQLKNLNEWSSTLKSRRWLLLSGATNPPKEVLVSTRRRRDANFPNGNFLDGSTPDLYNMERAVKPNLFNVVRNLTITKNEAARHITEFFAFCHRENHKPMLYYTGHGETSTGNWCFADGTIGIQQVLDWHVEGMELATICSDACYSGKWAEFCARKNLPGFHCLSACRGNKVAFDSG